MPFYSYDILYTYGPEPAAVMQPVPILSELQGSMVVSSVRASEETDQENIEESATKLLDRIYTRRNLLFIGLTPFWFLWGMISDTSVSIRPKPSSGTTGCCLITLIRTQD